jgi:DNA/RNA-binding domain of Phe-tRNA-synthetase-like protein
VLCRRWNWRQDARSLVTTTTDSAVITLQSNGSGDLDRAVADLLALIASCVGGATSVGIADRDRPVAALR